MEKYSETDPEVRNQRFEYVNIRWGQLHSLEKDWGEKAIRYLLMTNSGGAIATLSFLGASETAASIPFTKIALFLFLFGVFLVGVSTAKQFHYMSYLFEAYKKDVNEYFSDNKSWEQVCSGDDDRAVEDIFDYIIPYASFGCFISGCILGACALFGCA
jgi:hypothetical protein